MFGASGWFYTKEIGRDEGRNRLEADQIKESALEFSGSTGGLDTGSHIQLQWGGEIALNILFSFLLNLNILFCFHSNLDF